MSFILKSFKSCQESETGWLRLELLSYYIIMFVIHAAAAASRDNIRQGISSYIYIFFACVTPAGIFFQKLGFYILTLKYTTVSFRIFIQKQHQIQQNASLIRGWDNILYGFLHTHTLLKKIRFIFWINYSNPSQYLLIMPIYLNYVP